MIIHILTNVKINNHNAYRTYCQQKNRTLLTGGQVTFVVNGEWVLNPTCQACILLHMEEPELVMEWPHRSENAL